MAQPKRKRMPEAWLGILPELRGYGRLVVAESKTKAEAALLAEWRKFDHELGSDYRGEVKGFSDLSDIYGAHVRLMPWNVAVIEGQE